VSRTAASALAASVLPHAGLAFEQDGLAHPGGQEQSHTQRLVSQVPGGIQIMDERADIGQPPLQLAQGW
jgi:hypothetical protein